MAPRGLKNTGCNRRRKAGRPGLGAEGAEGAGSAALGSSRLAPLTRDLAPLTRDLAPLTRDLTQAHQLCVASR